MTLPRRPLSRRTLPRRTLLATAAALAATQAEAQPAPLTVAVYPGIGEALWTALTAAFSWSEMCCGGGARGAPWAAGLW